MVTAGSRQFGFSSRFECKYLISPILADEIRGRLSLMMRLDRFCALSPTRAYRNNSLYLDTPSRLCYWSSEHGEKNRFKLRFRWYTSDLAPPLFLEEKRRTTDAISKVRVAVDRDELLAIMEGRPVDGQRLLHGLDLENNCMARELADKMERLDARASCFVRYWREAWVSDEYNYLRITFDTEVEGHEMCGRVPDEDSPGWEHVDERRTILEIKFEQAMPLWVREMIETFELRRCSVPKYTLCLDALDASPWTSSPNPAALTRSL